MQVCAQHTNPVLTVAEADIHRMQPGDANGVTELMREVYGNTYPKRYVYDPAQLREKNAAGEISSVVATSPEGTVIGYAALSAYYGYPEIGLIGSVAVSPSCRGQGLGGKLVRCLVSCNDGTAFRALTGGTFTVHPYSQWTMENEGFCPTAILLGSQPQDISFREIAENLSQRESIAFYTRVPAPKEYEFQYLPDNHRKTIREICRKLGVGINADGTGRPGRESSIIEHTMNADTGAGLIWIRRAGPDYRQVFTETVRELRAGGAQVLRLHLDLNDPGSTAVASAAEEAGFIFSGILPGEKGLILILQHLQDMTVDLRKIRMGGNPCGERLLSYIGTQIRSGEDRARQASWK